MYSDIRHLFFDLDHTLWDFDSNSKAALQMLHNRNPEIKHLDFEEFYYRYRINNKKFWDRFSKSQISMADLKWKRIWHTLMDFKILDVTLAHSLSQEYLILLTEQKKLCPHALDVLEYLKCKNYQLHIITNGFKETQHNKMRRSGIIDCFETITTAECIGQAKPHPEIFDHALQKAGAKKQESIYIGDNWKSDVMGSTSFGIPCIYYNAETPPLENLDKCRHIQSLQEIKEIL